MVEEAVGPAAVETVVQIAEEVVLLPQVRAEQSEVPVLVVVVVLVLGFVLVWVSVSVVENKSDSHVLHGSEPIIFHRLHR